MKTNIEQIYLEGGPIEWPSKHATTELWKKQTELMQEYHNSGKLPSWPMALNDRLNQKFLRELMGFLEEEVFEAASLYPAIVEAVSKNQPEELPKLLLDFNEEIADTHHFWIELFIYNGYTVRDISNFYLELDKVRFFGFKADEDPLEMAFKYSSHHIQTELTPNRMLIHSMDKTDPLRIAGSEVGPNLLELFEKSIYQCVKHLNLSRNYLKNKYWTNSDREVDVAGYNMSVMEAWLQWNLAITLTGATYSSVTQCYLLKNKINHIRHNKTR